MRESPEIAAFDDPVDGLPKGFGPCPRTFRMAMNPAAGVDDDVLPVVFQNLRNQAGMNPRRGSRNDLGKVPIDQVKASLMAFVSPDGRETVP